MPKITQEQITKYEMSNEQLSALVNALIALCQREGILPTDQMELLGELQTLASDETYISFNELEELF